MNVLCWWYQSKLTAHASAALPEAIAARVESHVAHCAACASELALQVQLTTALRQATPTAAEPNPYLWERLEAAMVSDKPAPQVPLGRRLAPFAGVALAGAAVASVVMNRPILPTTAPAQPAAPLAVAIAPTPKPMLARTRPIAVAMGLKAEKLEGKVGVRDPFAPARPQVSRPAPWRREAIDIPHVVRHRHDTEAIPVAGQAVAMVEVGARRLIEEAHTARLNRQVAETELEESAQRGQHPEANATDATTLAQNTRSLFQ